MSIIEQTTNIFRIRDLRRRLLITVALIALCRVGVYIPLPGVNARALGEAVGQSRGGVGAVLGLMNMFTGGALANGAVFGLGIMPYISASIIFTLLSNVIPSLEKLRKEGEAGQRKLNQYTRIATVFICLFQGAVIVRGLYGWGVVPEFDSWLDSLWFSLSSGLLLMSGTMFLMWIGEQIDQHGLGNGISMIIMVSILARLPTQIMLMGADIQRAESQQDAILKIVALIGLFIALVVAIIYITEAERRIPVQQAKHVRGPKVYGGQKHYLPLKVNQAGVMPLIFAMALLQFPVIVANGVAQSMTNTDSLWYGIFSFIRDALSAGQGLRLGYVLVYGMLIFFFCYFWTAMMFNPQEMAENLKDHGSFIPGIRPGARTADYLEGIMNRVTLAGSCFLIGIALMPLFVSALLRIPAYAAGIYGGTSILIVVGVALRFVEQINQHLEMRRYSGFAAGAAGRRRTRRRR